MTREESFELLGVPPDTAVDAVRARMRELYSEYQMRLTNAPTTSLRLTYQRNLSELEEVGRNLLGADASLDEFEDLPVAEPSMGGSIPVPKNIFGGREERDCPQCGERILAKAARCRHCGQPVTAATSTIGTATQAIVGAPRPSGDTQVIAIASVRRQRRWIVPIALLGIVVAGLGAYRFVLTPWIADRSAVDGSRGAATPTMADLSKPPSESLVTGNTTGPSSAAANSSAEIPNPADGYGPFRWGMTMAEVRAVPESNSAEASAWPWQAERGQSLYNGTGPLRVVDHLPDKDIVAQSGCSRTSAPGIAVEADEKLIAFNFIEGHLVGVTLILKCNLANPETTSPLPGKFSQLKSRYHLTKRAQWLSINVGSARTVMASLEDRELDLSFYRRCEDNPFNIRC